MFGFFENKKSKRVRRPGNTGYFMNDNEPSGIENATHNTFPKLTWLFYFILNIVLF
jgi:hypothetical protein